ncbi:hypothetical protein F5Y13DRAFT_173965 [Hypoxylon sp. FL1857]|nr:hypothetical protein F5Y13DRAFT_173965 [Hypoxylon sp. FL1857]
MEVCKVAETLSMPLPPRRVSDRAIRPPRVITIHVVVSWRYFFLCHPRIAEPILPLPPRQRRSEFGCWWLFSGAVVQGEVSTLRRDTRLRVTSGCEETTNWFLSRSFVALRRSICRIATALTGESIECDNEIVITVTVARPSDFLNSR